MFVLEITEVGAIVVGVFPLSGLQEGMAVVDDAGLEQGWLPGSPGERREPCWVNTREGNGSAEHQMLDDSFADYPPCSPVGPGDGFGSALPPHPSWPLQLSGAGVFQPWKLQPRQDLAVRGAQWAQDGTCVAEA